MIRLTLAALTLIALAVGDPGMTLTAGSLFLAACLVRLVCPARATWHRESLRIANLLGGKQ